MLTWSRDAFVSALALSLLHSLWQGAVLGLLGATLNARLQRATPDVRCGAFFVLLLSVFTVWVGTFCCLYGTGPHVAPPASSAFSSSMTTSVSGASTATFASALLDMAARIQPLCPVLVGFWTLGVCGFSLRYFGGLLLLRRLLKTATAPCPPQWTRQADSLAKRMGLRRSVRLLCSTRIDIPCVFGLYRACILLPLGAMSCLTPDQAEALIAHEMAHLARHDVAINFVQVCIETAMFYHPAVAWLSRQIREAREQHCDDLAVKFIGDRTLYARALFSLEEARAATPRLALGAGGSGDTQLVLRIRRILGVSAPERRDPWARGVMALAAAAIGFAALQPVNAFSHTDRAKNARLVASASGDTNSVKQEAVIPTNIAVVAASDADATKTSTTTSTQWPSPVADPSLSSQGTQTPQVPPDALKTQEPLPEAQPAANSPDTQSSPQPQDERAQPGEQNSQTQDRPVDLATARGAAAAPPAASTSGSVEAPVSTIVEINGKAARLSDLSPVLRTKIQQSINVNASTNGSGAIVIDDADQKLTPGESIDFSQIGSKDLTPELQEQIRQSLQAATAEAPRSIFFAPNSDGRTNAFVEFDGKKIRLSDLNAVLQLKMQHAIPAVASNMAIKVTE